MKLPPRDSRIWTGLAVFFGICYWGAHCISGHPGAVETIKDVSSALAAGSAKLAWSPLDASKDVTAKRSWLRQILDAIASEVP